MADEQYRWLDRDTAERLLRGEPPGTADTAVTARAERLARALDSLTAGLCPEPPADEELPGEAAALAAFRKARAEAADAARSAGTAEAGLGGGLPARRSGLPPADAGLLRLGGRPGARAHERGGRPRHPVRRRPVRLALSAALAASAIGAAAVTTTVLPTPFGDARPSPAASVSDWPAPQGPAAASPDIARELPATEEAAPGSSDAVGRDALRGESTAGPRSGEHDGRAAEPGPSHRPGEPGRGDEDTADDRAGRGAVGAPGPWGEDGAGEKGAHGGKAIEGRPHPTLLTGQIRSHPEDQNGAGGRDDHDGRGDGQDGPDRQEGPGGDGSPGLAPGSGHPNGQNGTGRNDKDEDKDGDGEGEHGRPGQGHHGPDPGDDHGTQGGTRYAHWGNGHGHGSDESAGEDVRASMNV
ncbi:extensin [Streptomyces thermoviolaceus]|uniref:extensin n=1 Tax=Streptomyces thermoviolaceus TaxID=1952 RepID=UPI00386C4621|nr:extensin [Streptomyces thermoviolaceus]